MLGFLDALFDFAHAAEVLFELLTVARGEVTFELFGVVADKVEDGSLLILAALHAFVPLAGRASAKQPLKQQSRVRFGRHGRARRTPGEVVLVRARITRIAVAAFAHGVAGEFERWKTRDVADLLGRHLVDGDAGFDVGPGGLAHADPGQERAAGASMVAGAIGTGRGVDVVHAAEDLQL